MLKFWVNSKVGLPIYTVYMYFKFLYIHTHIYTHWGGGTDKPNNLINHTSWEKLNQSFLGVCFLQTVLDTAEWTQHAFA